MTEENKEEEENVTYFLISSTLRDSIGSALMKNSWVDVQQIMSTLLKLKPLKISGGIVTNQDDETETDTAQEELPLNVAD